jgi:hypothetical protein
VKSHVLLDQPARPGGQRVAGEQRLGLRDRLDHPHAPAVVAAARDLEHHRPATLASANAVTSAARSTTAHAGHGTPAAEISGAHVHLVLGMGQGCRPRAHRDALATSASRIGAGHVLVVEGDHVAALRERRDGVRVVVGAPPDVPAAARRRLVRGGGQDAQGDPEGEGGLLGHPGQLPAPDHPHDGEARRRSCSHDEHPIQRRLPLS